MTNAEVRAPLALPPGFESWAGEAVSCPGTALPTCLSPLLLGVVAQFFLAMAAPLPWQH